MNHADELVKLSKASKTASVVFHSLGLRERDRADVDLNRLKKRLIAAGYPVMPAEFSAVFEALQSLGLGRIERGLGGQARFFKTTYSLRSIGRVAVGDAHAKLRPFKSRGKPATVTPIRKPVQQPAPLPKPAAAEVKPLRLTLNVNGKAVGITLESGNMSDAVEFARRLAS